MPITKPRVSSAKKTVVLTDESIRRGNLLSKQAVMARMPRKDVLIGGRKLRLYSIAWLGVLARKSPRTIHRLERIGVLPKPLYALPDGFRWYTAAELLGYSKLIISANLRPGRYSNGGKQTVWLKVNAFGFRAKLKERMQIAPETVKQHLERETAILSELTKTKKIRYTEEDVMRLLAE